MKLMSSLKSKSHYEPMIASNYDSRVIALFQPTQKVMKLKVGYRIIEHFNNLSNHEFKQNEIDFLCDCYHSGSYSLIGVTNLHGERRLTIPGISSRYRIDFEVVKKWLVTYKRKMRLLKKIMVNNADGNEYIIYYYCDIVIKHMNVYLYHHSSQSSSLFTTTCLMYKTLYIEKSAAMNPPPSPSPLSVLMKRKSMNINDKEQYLIDKGFLKDEYRQVVVVEVEMEYANGGHVIVGPLEAYFNKWLDEHTRGEATDACI